MIDLSKRSSAKKILQFLDNLKSDLRHRDTDCNRNWANSGHEKGELSCERDGISVRSFRDSNKYGITDTSGRYTADIYISPRIATKRTIYESDKLHVWNSAKGWLHRGPWEKKIEELFETLELEGKELEMAEEKKVANRIQHFVDDWS